MAEKPQGQKPVDPKEAVLQLIRGGVALETAGARIGITEQELDAWDSDEDFKRALSQASATALAVAEAKLLKDKPSMWLQQGPGRRTLRRARPIEDPSKPRQCKALTKRGKGPRCRKYAIRGGEVCRNHGGAAPQVKAAAERRLELDRIGKLMEQFAGPDQDPIDGLKEEVQRSATAVAILTSLVSDLDAGEGGLYGDDHRGEGAPHVLIKMWNEERDRHARMCMMALQAGVSERQTQIAEEQGAMLARLIAAVFDDPALGLSPDQRRLGKRVAAGHMRALPSAG